MRTIIRGLFLTVLTLFILDHIFSWVRIDGTHILITCGVAFYLLDRIGRPILKILWLPINIVTLGLFSWVLNIAVVLIVILFIPGFHLDPASFSQLQIGKILIPAINLKMFWTYFLFSFLLTWGESFLWWLLVEE